MKQSKKLLALLLCIVMCLSLFPVSAFAADEEPAEEIFAEEITAEAPETIEETDEAAEPEEGSDAEEPDAAQEPAEPAEEADPAEEPAGEEGDGDETGAEPKELPCGFAGMPAGYEFSEEELAAKRVLTEMGIVDAVRNGGSYVEGELVLSTTSEEYAELAAQAYCAELVSFDGYLAVIQLSDATVPEAVEAAADMELPLPAVEPNWICFEAPVSCELAEPDVEEQALTARYWQDWYNYVVSRYGSSKVDPLLRYPYNQEYTVYDDGSTSTDYCYQWQHDAVHSYTAWGVTTGSSDIIVAVIDSGVNYNQADLSGRVIKGRDYVGNDNDPMDENDHGTHVAGIIAGSMHNGSAGVGIAPNVRIMAIRVCDADGYYNTTNLASAIRYAYQNGADIINMSLSGPWYNSGVKAAVDEAYGAGVTVIAAMGNNGTNMKRYPAAYDHVIAVGATNRDGSRAPFSNYGAWCDVSAPGVDISSTVRSGLGVMSGTSQATPIVSGVAALYMSVYGHTAPAAMEKILKAAVNKGGGSGMGKGIIDAAKIFKKMKSPPVYSFSSAPGVNAVNGSVPQDGYIRLESGSGFTADSARFLYTTDGRDPAVLDGEAVVGQDVCELGWYDEEQGCYILPMTSFAVGETVRFKFIEVEAGAIASEIAETEVVITAAAPEIANVRVGISGAGKLRLGQSTVLTAQVYGESAAEGVEVQQVAMPDQTVVWSVIEPAGDDRVSVDENGTVTVSKDFDGDRIVVRAESTVYFDEDGAPVFADYVLDVSALLRVGSISLAGEVPTLYTGAVWNPELVITDEEGAPMSLEEAGLVWTSSNEKVATVSQGRNEETGLYEVTVRCVQPGNVKLTGTASDGSGEDITIMATVYVPVNSVAVTGPSIMQPGSTVTFKATVAPKNATNKALTWSISGSTSGITIDPNTGKVTVATYASIGQTFTVAAHPKDNPNLITLSKSVTVDYKATGVSLTINGSTVKSGSTVTVYSVNLPETSVADNRVTIKASRLGVSYGSKGIVWSGGNSKVASFSDNGSGTITVTAFKAGKATFTAKAMDGSGKTAKITVKVITPASSMTIVSKTKGETQYIGYGKSAKNKAVLGNSYGKPSVSKVFWEYEIYQRSGSDWVYSSYLTDYAYSNKLIKISSSGTLTLTAKAATYLSGINYRIEVWAGTTDGTGYWDSTIYYPIALTKTLRLYYPNGDPLKKSYYIYRSDAAQAFGKDDNNRVPLIIGGFTKAKNYTMDDYSLTDYVVKSSNPSVLSATVSYGSNGIAYLNLYYDKETWKTGTAKITVTACDGSNKSTSITFQVRK